jgi:hypothetical protein
MNKFKLTFILVVFTGLCTISFTTRNSKEQLPQDRIEKVKILKDGVLYQTIDPNEKVNTEILKGHEPASNLAIRFNDYLFTIFDYGTYQSAINFNTGESTYYKADSFYNMQITIKDYNNYYLSFPETQDTIKLEEWTFNNLFNSLIKIEPISPKADEHFKLSIALNESIWESFLTTGKDRWDESVYEKWAANEQVKWDGTTRFYPIKDSANYYYRVPEMESLTEFDELTQKLSLRDTLVVIPGVYDDVSTIVYKNKPCHFLVASGILKIEKYKGTEVKDTKYIRIEFSYGC